jgi:hypothetical protein
MTSQPPDQPWQVPQNVWQQPPYGASPQPSQPPELPKRAGRGLGCAIAAIVAVVVLIVVGGVIWGGVAFYHAYKTNSTNTHARGATSSATKPKPQPQTADGLNGLLTEIRNHFGDTMGYELDVFSDSALIKRVDPNNIRHEKGYLYANSEWTDWGVNSMAADAAVADLSKFDVTAVTAKLPGAPQSLGMTDAKQINLDVQGLADGSLKLDIWLSNGVDQATMELNPDGSVKALHPPS